MNEQMFKDRTKKLALEVIKMSESLPNTRAADIIGRQVLRSATSVGANYRAACRAKSTGDMIAKLAIVEEEGAQKAAYALKLLQSEGEITIASTGKDPGTGKLVTKAYRVERPVLRLLAPTAM